MGSPLETYRRRPERQRSISWVRSSDGSRSFASLRTTNQWEGAPYEKNEGDAVAEALNPRQTSAKTRTDRKAQVIAPWTR